MKNLSFLKNTMPIKKIIFFIIALIFGNIWGQNNLIKNTDNNTLLPESILYCEGKSFALTVDASARDNQDYTITEQNISLTDTYSSVPFSTQNGDDKFSKPLDLGFDFNFFGKSYTKVVVGANGRLVFTNAPEIENLHNNSVYIDRVHSGNYPNSNHKKLPSVDYNKIYRNDTNKELKMAHIFAGYTDLRYFNLSAYEKITYKNFIYDNKKALQISFNPVVERDNDQYNTTMSSRILLLEDGTYYIQMINKKAGQNSILGAQNEFGDKAVVHSEYNNEKWSIDGQGKTFAFTPKRKEVASIKWFVNNIQKHIGENFNYTPNANTETLKAQVSYTDGSTTEGQVVFNKIPKLTFQHTSSAHQCNVENKLLVDNPQNGLEYHWFLKEGSSYKKIGSGEQISILQSGEYYVIANNCTASQSDAKNINITTGVLLSISINEGQIFTKCNHTDTYEFDLNALVQYPINTALYSILYSENGTPIGNKIILRYGDTKTLKITVKTLDGSCEISRNFNISYHKIPEIGKDITIPTKLCFEDVEYTVEDFKKDFPEYSSFDIYFSTDNINFNLSSINPRQNTYIKIFQKGDTCEYQGKVNFNFLEEIVVKPYTQFPEHCYSSTEYFDLNITKQQLEYDNVTATFYLNYSNNVFSEPINNLHFRGSGKVYIKLENANGCIYQGEPPVLELKIYKPPTLKKTTPELKKTACGSRIFNLTTQISDYVDWNRYAEIRYYNANGVQLSEEEYKNYNADISGQPYMIFIYNQTNNLECSNRIEFKLEYLTKPEIKAENKEIPICEETSYPLEAFKQRVIENAQNYQFLQQDGVTELTSDISWSNLPHTFQFYIKNKETGCISDLQEVRFVALSPISLLNTTIDYQLCDSDFDGRTQFDLDSKKAEFTRNTNAVFEYFRDKQRTQPISAQYINTTITEEIFVKVSANGFCPSYGSIKLKVNSPTKSTTLKDKYFICYGDTTFVDAGTENISFQWSSGQTTQTATFSEAGTYSVTLQNAGGCSYVHTFVVSDENQPKIKQINTHHQHIEVIAEGGIPPYQYSFDNGATWQNSNILYNPTQEVYNIQVKSVNGCKGEPKSLYNVKIFNVITPNGDGKNDTWEVANLDQMEQVEIIITDRYGKTIFQSNDKKNITWDGKINGRPLPTGTYWYIVKWFDANRNKNELRQGWILLKNRD